MIILHCNIRGKNTRNCAVFARVSKFLHLKCSHSALSYKSKECWFSCPTQTCESGSVSLLRHHSWCKQGVGCCGTSDGRNKPEPSLQNPFRQLDGTKSCTRVHLKETNNVQPAVTLVSENCVPDSVNFISPSVSCVIVLPTSSQARQQPLCPNF